MNHWKFKAFVKDSGRNDFQDCMDYQSETVRAMIHEVMDYIEINPQLGPQFVTKLKGYNEIWELKAKVNNIQYRPLFCLGPEGKELVFLIWATKTGDRKKTKFDPISAPETAEKRRKLIFKERRYIGEYSRTKRRSDDSTQK